MSRMFTALSCVCLIGLSIDAAAAGPVQDTRASKAARPAPDVVALSSATASTALRKPVSGLRVLPPAPAAVCSKYSNRNLCVHSNILGEWRCVDAGYGGGICSVSPDRQVCEWAPCNDSGGGPPTVGTDG